MFVIEILILIDVFFMGKSTFNKTKLLQYTFVLR